MCTKEYNFESQPNSPLFPSYPFFVSVLYIGDITPSNIPTIIYRIFIIKPLNFAVIYLFYACFYIKTSTFMHDFESFSNVPKKIKKEKNFHTTFNPILKMSENMPKRHLSS